MFSTRLYFRILLSVLLIVLTLGLGLAGIVSRQAVILGTLTVGAALGLTAALVRHLNACNRKIKLFLDSIADQESMLHFPENAGPRELRSLYASFNSVYALISEHKRNELQRKLNQKEYESWEKLMRVLTHEIMNSITPVVSLSETLLSYFQDKRAPRPAAALTDRTVEKTIRGLETIKSQGQNLIYFTTSYRQISGLKQPEFKDFPLARLIENVRTLYQEDLQRQHIDFRADLFQPEIQIRADEKMLSQVLINLLKNAMQAVAERPEKRIRLKAYRQGTRLLVEITDNGPGIPSHSLEDIFIPFFTTKPNGTGIGLSLSRQIVRLHGGELSVSSQPFHETSFTVSLPLGHSPGPFRPAGATA